MLSALLIALQVAAPVIVRGSGYEITIPYGWKALMVSVDALLEHSDGASLRITRPYLREEFRNLTRRTAERLAAPLGFAKIGEPRRFRDSSQEWVEYDIRGNRLAER